MGLQFPVLLPLAGTHEVGGERKLQREPESRAAWQSNVVRMPRKTFASL